jgi:hypothetical protein
VTDNGTVLALQAPTLLINNTYRYYFAPGTTFTAGLVSVRVAAGSWNVFLDGNSATPQAGGGSVSSFTLTPADPNSTTTSGSF